MKNYGEATRLGAAGSTISFKDVNGKNQSFDLKYNGLTNSCIDYVWKALSAGGLNPEGFQGQLWPTWNASYVSNTLDKIKSSIDSQSSLFNTDKQMESWYRQGQIEKSTFDSYTSWSTARLLSDNLFWYKPPSFSDWYDPIGAFYESTSPALDLAPSIANKTFRIMNSAEKGLTAAELAALDVNADGKLDGAELEGLYAWSDLNEDGISATLTQRPMNSQRLLQLSLMQG